MSALSVIMDFDVSSSEAPPPPSSGLRTQAWSEDSAPKLAAPEKPTPPKPAPPMPGYIFVGYAGDGGGPSDQPQIFFFESEPPIPENEAPDYLELAILATILLVICFPFFLPISILGIKKSRECRAARLRGDRLTALVRGEEARRCCKVSLQMIAGMVIAMLIVVTIIVIKCKGGKCGNSGNSVSQGGGFQGGGFRQLGFRRRG